MTSTMRQYVGLAMQRAFLVALACAVSLATFVSAFTIAELHDHDCSGDGCPTCLVLDAAQAMLGSAATAVSPAASDGVVIAVPILVLVAWALALSAKTPVSEKVLLLI